VTPLAVLALAAWLYLALAHGGYWRTRPHLPGGPDPTAWPAVVAVVPARDEAEVLPGTLPTLLAQDYPGPFSVVVVDDASSDGTGDLARGLGATVVAGEGPPPGWTGKVAAMAAGAAAAGEPEYVLFTDADIAHPPGGVAALVRAAEAGGLDLVSLMARLHTGTAAERAVVPAFVYFFGQLYPFARVSDPRSRVAAAAGGCMLVRRAALERAGGLAAIRGALIDDVALGRLLKRSGGRTWLGHTTAVRSTRVYPRFADLWDMVARSAFTQLRHSVALLAGTVVGLAALYVVPPVAAVAGAATGDWPAFGAGLAAWALLSATYLPVLRLYGLRAWRAPLLPAVAVAYAGMTVDSAVRHARGRGGAWKGRTDAGRVETGS
jgi:hopene-associated glycosyltransferase HpnB